MADLVLTRHFPASPDRVYDAWTVPENWTRWIGPVGVDCVLRRMDPVVGGTYLLIMLHPKMGEIHVTGQYLVLDRPTRLTFTWTAADGSSPLTTVDLTFEKTDRGTRMTLTHSGLPEDQITSHEGGWASTCTKLETFLESDA